MEFVPLLVIAGTVKKLVDFVRYAKAGDWNGIVTQVVAWGAGFGVIVLVAHTPWAAGLVFGGFSLATIGLAGQAFVGLGIGSTTSLFVDVLKAADNSQSAAVPTLLGGPKP